MNKKEAVNKLAVVALIYKKEVINLMNHLGLASLSPNASQLKVNRIFIDNLTNKEFVEKLDEIVVKDSGNYSNAIFTITAIVVASLIVVGTAVKVGMDASSARKQRAELISEQRRATYLNEEERDEIARIEREKFQNMFLEAQAQYLNTEEQVYLEKIERKKKNIAMILTGGIVTVVAATYILK
tara:strand:+ start:974 stop:1525 length:552 start_codon:yes stop_codon:yes gene_type:complete